MKALAFALLFVTAPAWSAPTPVTEQATSERQLATPESVQSCAFESNEVGKLKFRGTTRQEAFERTSRACLKARIAAYLLLRGNAPTTERQILFAEDCVNKTHCTH